MRNPISWSGSGKGAEMMLPALSIAVVFLIAAFAFLLYRLTSRFSPETLDAGWL
jgi:hypothetical protein